jgi:hypothetical protein
MTTGQLGEQLRQHGESLRAKLLAGTYVPALDFGKSPIQCLWNKFPPSRAASNLIE